MEMEIICGKHTRMMDAAAFRARLSGFNEVLLDLGTGDGRFVVSQVNRLANVFGIGIDACRENLRDISRRENARTLFVIANALDLPLELTGTVSLLTVNFPWGSLLAGLLNGEAAVLDGMARVCARGARLEVRLNESAVREAGYGLAEASEKVWLELDRAGFRIPKVETIEAENLKTCPTTWARKIAFGRAPQGVLLQGVFR
jgi:16S rRNA (adenine(1408)-N(1))-methyltransferase